MFLHFLHGLVNDRERMSRCSSSARGSPTSRASCSISMWMKSIAKVSAAVKDWSGGTRIGATLQGVQL